MIIKPITPAKGFTYSDAPQKSPEGSQPTPSWRASQVLKADASSVAEKRRCNNYGGWTF